MKLKNLAIFFYCSFLFLSSCEMSDKQGVIIPPMTEPPKEVDTEPGWSPDGKTIAYTHELREIWMLDLQTTAKNFLTTGSLPAWSPDGKKIAFVKNGDIHVINLENKQISRLTNWGACFFPAWSPDGTKLAYDATTNWPTVPVDSAGIWTMNVDGSGKKQIVRFDGRMPNWSSDGSKLIFVQAIANNAPYNEITLINLKDCLFKRLTNNSFDDRYPSWSPDGSQIAWSSWGEGLNNPLSGIWVMNADGTNQRQLTKEGDASVTFAFSPSWSPDGTQIAYTGYNQESNTYTLWLIRADGSNRRQLTKP